MKPVLGVHNLSVRFANRLAVDDVSFEVYPGDLLGVVGPNGSGKTTLFRAILALQQYEGTVHILGHASKSRDLVPLVGYVPQRLVFEHNFPATVQDVISMGIPSSRQASYRKMLEQDLDNIPSSTYAGMRTEEMITSALDTVDLGHIRNRRIGELSGGELQRVFIAKSLIKDPLFLILDEPTTNIDPTTQALFYDIMKRLNEDGMTILWSSHDLNSMKKYSNKAACMNCKLCYHGSSNDLFTNDTLLKTYLTPLYPYMHSENPRME